MFSISSEPIERENCIARLRDQRSGALVVFEGWVRDHNEGKNVSSLDYQVYRELAQKEGDKILREALEKFNLQRVDCVHREGSLKIGDVAVWIGAVASHRGDAFKATRFVIDAIKERLPVWKKENYVDAPAEWVSCAGHHHHVHFKESDYYRKQRAVADQEVFRRSRVLVVGAGGLGCPVLTSLALAGVGDIEIVDFDRIEISNIHRQPLYPPNLVGEKKAVVAAAALRELNPFIRVNARTDRVAGDNVAALIRAKDLIVDCTDNLRTKYLLHDACFHLQIPLISASVFKKEGQLRTFVPKKEVGCLRCLSPETPDDALIGNCNEFGVLGASVAVIGGLQASEALELLQRGENASLHETVYFNLKDLTQFKVRNKRAAACATCRGDVEYSRADSWEVTFGDLSGDFELLDIRDRDISDLEAIIARFETDKKLVLYCHRGLRSRSVVEELRSRGCRHVYSLIGGAASL